MSSVRETVPAAQAGREIRRWALNRRQRTLIGIAACVGLYALVLIGSRLIGEAGLSTNLAGRNLPPSLQHPFGTDWLGRDMFTRTLHGLSLSLSVGLIAAGVSAFLGVLIGLAAATFGGVTDAVITWVIDVFFSLPHLVLLIMIAFAVGGGTTGVVVAVGLTHWTSLARIMRAEVLQLKSAQYVQLAARLGRSPFWIARRHMVPHLIPQLLVGLIMLFPHAVLHEAALSFIGIGIAPHLPAIGIILAESMRYLVTGVWWLALFPGVALLLVVKSFDLLGEQVRALIDPQTRHE